MYREEYHPTMVPGHIPGRGDTSLLTMVPLSPKEAELSSQHGPSRTKGGGDLFPAWSPLTKGGGALFPACLSPTLGGGALFPACLSPHLRSRALCAEGLALNEGELYAQRG